MVQVAGLIAYHAARFLIIMPRGSALSCRGVLLFSIMPAVYIIMPRCLLPIRKRVHGSGSRSYCLSFRAVLNHHAARVIVYHAGGSTLSFRAVLNHHSAGLIAYQVAGLLSIIPRCYSAGGSALSCRGVIVYHAGVVIVYHAAVL